MSVGKDSPFPLLVEKDKAILNLKDNAHPKKISKIASMFSNQIGNS